MVVTRDPLLEVNGLKVEFRTREGTVRAVDGLSFSLARGETLAIVGESGSGKSCSVLSIMGLIPEPSGRITGGEIKFHNSNLLELNEEALREIRGRQIAMIFQDPMSSLNPLLTVETQIGELLQLHMDMNRSQARNRSIELLHLAGIPDPEQRLDNYPHQLSGGMRQRVMIAMGLACHPELLIADEPTTALDVTIQAQIIDLVKRLREENSMAIIWISHDLAVVAGLADRVLVMYAGQVVEEAPVDGIFNSPQHPYTIGLLKSLPRIDVERGDKLPAIRGLPPDLFNLPAGCPFAVRCDRAVERCRQEVPVLEPCGEQHRVACWEVTHPHRMAGPESPATVEP